jgi:hypothetical protein
MFASSYEVPSRAMEQFSSWGGRATDVSVNKTSRSLFAARCVLADLVASGDPAPNIQSVLAILSAPWLQRHGLAALAWVRYQALTDLPGGIHAKLKHTYYTSLAGTALFHHAELILVLKALNDCGIVPAPFKGAALAFTVYPKSVCRSMGDLDLWVTDAEMDIAQQALESVGYQYRSKLDRPLAIMKLFMGERQMYGTRSGTGLVELHWGVFAGEWLRRTAMVNERAIRQRLRPAALLGQQVALLAPEDAVLQLAAHTAINHQFSLSALRSLVDVSLLVRHQPLEWSVLVQRAREWRVATATWRVLSLAVDLCGLAEAAEATRQLAPSRLRQKLIGLFANAESLVNNRNLSLSKWRYVYLLLIVDRKRDVVKLVYRALWPENEWLLARYGQGGGRLRHVFDAARGKI